MFDEKKDFAVDANKFIAICDEISSYSVEIDAKDMLSKLIRSFPASFCCLNNGNIGY